MLQSRPWNALHYRPVTSDKLKVGGFRFLINVYHGQYPVLALSGNAVVLPWNAECHVPRLCRSLSHTSPVNLQAAPLPAIRLLANYYTDRRGMTRSYPRQH